MAPGHAPLCSLLALLLHPVASLAENNRYVKLTLLPDAVRVAYTVLYGDAPGERERRAMDSNHDGQLTPAETRTFATHLAADVERLLAVEIDGRTQPIHFGPPEVGLGMERTVRAAPFSVDLIALVPLPKTPPPHPYTMWIDDRYEPPIPGEAELVVEEAPGVRVLASYLGRHGAGVQATRWTFLGPRARENRERSVTVVFAPAIWAQSATRAPRGGRWAIPIALLLALGATLALKQALQKRKRS